MHRAVSAVPRLFTTRAVSSYGFSQLDGMLSDTAAAIREAQTEWKHDKKCTTSTSAKERLAWMSKANKAFAAEELSSLSTTDVIALQKQFREELCPLTRDNRPLDELDRFVDNNVVVFQRSRTAINAR